MPILSSGLISQVDSLFVQLLGEMCEYLGRNVTVVNYQEINCPNCSYDPINQESAGIYQPDDPYPENVPGPIPFSGGICPVCNGKGKYVTRQEQTIKALVNWATPRDRAAMSAGFVEPWDVSVQVSPSSAEVIRNADEIYVDDVRVQYLNMQKGGLKTIAGVTIELRKIGESSGEN